MEGRALSGTYELSLDTDEDDRGRRIFTGALKVKKIITSNRVIKEFHRAWLLNYAELTQNQFPHNPRGVNFLRSLI